MMVNGRNPKYVDDFVDPFNQDCDANDGSLNVTPQWFERHWSTRLTQAEAAGLRKQLDEWALSASLKRSAST